MKDSGLEALILLTKQINEQQTSLLKKISDSMDNTDIVSALEALIVATKKQDSELLKVMNAVSEKKSKLDLDPIKKAISKESKAVIKSIDDLKKKYKDKLRKIDSNEKAIADLRAEVLKDLQAVARERFSAPAVQNFIKQFSFEDVDPEQLKEKIKQIQGAWISADQIKDLEDYLPEPQVYRGPTTFAGLTDTPSNLMAGKWFKVNAEGTAIELVDAPSGGGSQDKSEYIIIGASDETTDLEVGTAKTTFRIPWTGNITAVRASLTTAPTGANFIVDINKGGASILGDKITIEAGDKTSRDAADQPTIITAGVTDDDEYTIDIDQIGSTVAGAGLKVTIIGTRS